jgi:hypothetical protein
MAKLSRIVIVVFSMVLSLVAQEVYAASEMNGSCEDWANIVSGPYVLFNNVWGKRDITDYEACVAISGEKEDRSFSWKWRWPYGPDVVAYPEIIFGRSPWREESTTPDLPRMVGKSDPQVKFKTDLEAKGMYNLTFDLWITRNDSPKEADITHEIMIWVANSGGIPDGKVEHVVKIEGVEYDIWVKRNHGTTGWTYIAFVGRMERRKGKLDFGAFLSSLIKKDLLSPELFLSSIEFGTEITGGEGKCAIAGYKIDM